MLVTKSLERMPTCCTTSLGTAGDHKGPPSQPLLTALAPTGDFLRKIESYHLTLMGVSSRIADMDISTQLLHVAIKRIDTDLPLPTYATAGSVGFDLMCREDIEIAPRTVELIPSNVIVKIPAGYMLMLTLRSSTPLRKGLLIPNGVGIIDQDYCGEGDELKVQVFNFRDEAVTVSRGERIAQGIFIPVMGVRWHEVDEMGQGRGGFGSTGI
jgi:dUTP pyrophosphatase